MENVFQHIISVDNMSKPLDGDKSYQLHLHPDVHLCNFWSVIVFDSQTHMIIETDQTWPSVHKQLKNLIINADRSIDIRFGSFSFENIDCNWIKTISGKTWYLTINLYQPPDNWILKNWQPDDLTELDY